MTTKATLINALAGTLSRGPSDTITVNSGTVTDIDFISPFSASVLLTYESDGTISTFLTQGSDNADALGNWIDPLSSAPGNYEIKATLSSGTLTSGVTGTWLALTSDRSWSVSRSTTGTTSATLTIEIRDDGGPTLDSGTVTISAECGF